MRRLLLVPLLALLALPSAASGHGERVLKELYSSGSIATPIPDAATLEQSITVTREGEVAAVRSVQVRLDHARDTDLTLRLVAPNGKSVLLSAGNGGGGADYGSGSRDCQGAATVFSDAGGTSISAGTPPFVGTFSPQQRLARLTGSRSDGVWKLRISDGAAGATGTLYCWKLALSRSPATVERARAGTTSAELSYVRSSTRPFLNARLKILRSGTVLYDHGLTSPCRGCEAWPSGYYSGSGSLHVRDLDGDSQPEVVVDLYTGGAHCCFYSLVYRHAGAGYVRSFHWWGDPGYRFADLDRDGRPELVSADDRFAYAFSCFACSGLPVQIWDYRAGRFVDVTRRFPSQIKADARMWWKTYRYARSVHGDYSGLLAAWLADQYLLRHGPAGWKQVRAAVARPEFKQWWKPANYLRALRVFLRRTGYIR